MIPRFKPTRANEKDDRFASDALLQFISEAFQEIRLTEEIMYSVPGKPIRPNGMLATAAAHLTGDAGLWTKCDDYALSTEEETGFLWILCCWGDRPADCSDISNEWFQEPGAQISGNTYCWRKPFLLFLLNKTRDDYCAIDKETIPKISFVKTEECNKLSQKITPGWAIGVKEGEGTMQRCVRDGCPRNSNYEFIRTVILCRCKSRTYCSVECRELDKHDCIAPESTECSICCDPLIGSIDSELMMCKNCSNQFHKECIKPWISQNGTCPLCRFNWK